MGWSKIIPALLFLYILGAGPAREISTQPIDADSRRTNQIDSLLIKRSLIAPKADIDVAYLEKFIGQVMNDAITSKDSPGGVVLVLRGGKTVFKKAYGGCFLPSSPPLSTQFTTWLPLQNR